MNDQQVRVGVDPRGDWCYVARVAWGSGRPQVKALARFNSDQLTGHRILDDARQVLGVPDNLAQIKRVTVTPSGDIEAHELAAFELAQGLLDSPMEFCLSVVPLSVEGEYLGMSVRRATLEGLGVGSGPGNGGWQVRSAALTCGWTTFCRDIDGELIGLVDFTPGSATIAIMHSHRIAATACIATNGADLTTRSGQRRLGAELRTVFDFRLDSLAERGISVPLSGLVLCGADLADGLSRTIDDFFGVSLISPSVSPGFFPQSADLSAVPLDRYLVALGLTVE